MDKKLNPKIKKLLEDINREREAFEKMPLEQKVKVLKEKNESLRERIYELEEELEEKKRSITSSQTIECDVFNEIHVALVLIHSSGRVEVRCDGGCYDCKYVNI